MFKKILFATAFVLTFLCFVQSVKAEIITTDRRIDWVGNVGIQGDIPIRATVCATIDAVIYGDGIADATSVIQSAINGCSVGQVVYLPAGIYKISSQINISKGIVLRGAGMNATKIISASGFLNEKMLNIAPSNFSWNLSNETSYNIIAGLNKGSMSITTSISHNWNTGDIILIDQLSDPAGDPVIDPNGINGNCTQCYAGRNDRAFGQLMKIISAPTSNTAILEIPVYWSYNLAKSPQATRLSQVVINAGVENLTFDNMIGKAKTIMGLANVSNSWVKNVDFYGNNYAYMSLWTSYRSVIRGNNFHNTVLTGTQPNSGYGILLQPRNSANLFEDNLFYQTQMMFIKNGICSGNVYAYNYFTDSMRPGTTGAGGAIWNHGAHCFMELYEGNWMVGGFVSDNYWGSSSHQTFFRNKQYNETGATYGMFGIDLMRRSTYFNIVGNVLGTAGFETVYEKTNGSSFDGADKIIYTLGYDANSAIWNSIEGPKTKNTLYRQGNWDSVNNAVIWDEDSVNADHVLPNSLYLSLKPAWWGNLSWPAIGPDLNPMTNAIPAKARYEGQSYPYEVSPLKGDFNSDSKVNGLDFTSFKNAFKSIFNSIFDLNSDNAIDVKDLGVLMSGWLE